MTVIAHLADLHLGFTHLNPRVPGTDQNQRQADFEAAALACAEHLAQVKPDLVLIAGDTLHSPNLSMRALDGAVRFFDVLREAGLPCLVIGGNHDEAEAEGRFSSLSFLAAHHGVDVNLGQAHRDIAGVRCHLVSFRAISRAMRPHGGAELDEFDFAPDRPNVLVAHGYAPGLNVPVLPPDAEIEIPAQWIDDPRFDLVCLGHIHVHAQIRETKPVFYAGSIERRNFGEVDQTPGFWLHDVSADGSVTSTSVPVASLGVPGLPRPMLHRSIDCENLTASEVSERVREIVTAPEVEGSMMRLVLDHVSAQINRSRDPRTWAQLFRRAGGLHLDTTTKTARIAELLDHEFAAAPVDTTIALRDFIAAQTFDSDEERAEAIALAVEILDEAREETVSARMGDA